MKYMMIIMMMLGSLSSVWGRQDSVSVFFCRGYSFIEESDQRNGQQLKCTNVLIDSCRRDSLSCIVYIDGSVSPDGSRSANARLLKKRIAYFMSQIEGLDYYSPIVSDTKAPKEIYDELYARIYTSAAMPMQHQMLAIIAEISRCIDNDRTRAQALIRQMKALGHGEPYRWMYAHIYPLMRRATLKVVQRPSAKDSLINRPVPSQASRIPLPALSGNEMKIDRSLNLCSQSEVTGPKQPLYLAVRTNMLYDALLTPNIGLEYAFAHRFSVAANWMYAWWNNDSRHRYWRISGGDVELRYWLGCKAASKPLQGHHLGAYAQMLTYDIELGGKGYMGSKWNYSMGIAYGYSLPVARRLNLDFSVRLGYMGGSYEEYVPVDQCYVWQATKNRHYIGPTGAEVSLVWRIGRGNTNSRKGGRL